MTNEKTRAAIMALVDGFKFVCAEHGDKCDPHLTSDDLKQFVAHLEGERDRYKKALEHYANHDVWMCGQETCPEQNGCGHVIDTYLGPPELDEVNGYDYAQAALRGEE